MEKRNRQMHFRLTASEMERVEAKMEELGIKSLCAYLRKMALDGYCVKLDLQDVDEALKISLGIYISEDAEVP